MEGYLNLISVPAIATIVYWVINIIKHAVEENEKFKRFIPPDCNGVRRYLRRYLLFCSDRNHSGG